MEISGSPDAFTSMLEHMNHGGKIAMLGIPAAQFGVDWGKIIFKGLQIKGIYGREMFETWYKMVAMLQSGLDISPIITHRSEEHTSELQSLMRISYAVICLKK